MIKVSQLHFSFGKKTVLNDLSIDLEGGVLCGLFGPNGSGKSTLFRCCLGLLQVNSGVISLNGLDVHTTPRRKLARVASYVPQDHRSQFPFKVKEIVLMGRTPHMGMQVLGVDRRHRQAALSALENVGILDLAEQRYDQLSGGQRQLVLIARAVAQETPILFLDEPTSALDFDNQIRVWRVLRDLAGQGKCVIACSHDPNHVSWFCDRVIMLSQGEVVADGMPGEVINEETLRSIYREACRVDKINGMPVVIPEGTAKEFTMPPSDSFAVSVREFKKRASSG